jgi:lipopolysaccharide/colanic/teichoic acid biosynthesis glycosyltransferase
MCLYKHYVKRSLDFFISFIMIVILLPIFIFVSLFIYVDSGGPIIYKQKRVGKGLVEFYVYKFRTMVVSADKLGPTSTRINDNRITRAGKYLRKLSIDELPQLVNVMKGDMSLIGFRPGVLNNYDKEFLESEVFTTRPGITGLAQVTGRSQLSALKKRELERKYVCKITFIGDLKILYITAVKVFSGSNAF